MFDTTSVPDIFADNSTRHAELDRFVNADMDFLFPDGPQDDRRYAYLLSLIVKHSDKHLNDVYSDLSAALEKLDDATLKDELRRAWRSKSYQTIRNLGKFCLRYSSATQTCDDRIIVVLNNANENAMYISLI